MRSYFELGFGAYLTNMTAGIFFYLLLVKLFEIIFKRSFSPGWRYVIAIACAAFFLIPLKIAGPWCILPLGSFNRPLYITSPDPILLEGITEVNSYFTGAQAKGEFLYNWLFYLWAAGAAASLLYQIIRLAAFYGRVSKKSIPCANAGYKSILSGICGEMKVKAPGLVIFPEIDTPFAMGIFFPRIILPPEEFSEHETEYIFRHEVCHIKRHDILMKLFLIIFRCVNWFNPLAYILVKNAFSDMEIACDEKACRGFSSESREEYARTLLKGASRVKCPAVTTYLSPGARVIKKRIDAVMNIRKWGKAVPFTVAFSAVLVMAQTYYAMPDDRDLLYVFTDPYPMEADPYITSSEWRTAEGKDPKEAGEKIFRRYMEMYMGADVPEYYRIEDYYLADVYYYDESHLEDHMANVTKGVFTPHEYVSFSYSFIPANKCGNTVHNMNFGKDPHLNGVYSGCTMAFELEKNGSSYTAVNIGSVLVWGNTGYHFDNNLTVSVSQAAAMAQAGLLDYSWNDADSLPSPDDICEYEYAKVLRNREISRREYPERPAREDENVYLPSRMVFCNAMDIEGAHIQKAGCKIKNSEGEYIIDPEKVNIDESRGFEYCGFEINLEDCSAVIYGNVTGREPHGIRLNLYAGDSELEKDVYHRRLHSVEVTDKLFTPVEYHDSFGSIPLPEGITEAQEILEYMKTPRDGCDFTVMDYTDITEEAGGTYARVCFKGRLEGLYSSDLKKDGDGYIKVKVI